MIGATTSPCHAPSAPRNAGAAPQPDRRRVDRFLPERSEALALERRVAVADFAAGEERLQPVVDGAREDHAAQDLAPLVVASGTRRSPRGEKPVAGGDQLVDALRPPRLHAHGRRRLDRLVAGRPRRRPIAARAPAARARRRSRAHWPAPTSRRGRTPTGRRVAANGNCSVTNARKRSRTRGNAIAHGSAGSTGSAGSAGSVHAVSVIREPASNLPNPPDRHGS